MKSISLTCILKDEINNLERFCKSFGGLFDAYYFTDTGSTDGSKEWLESEAHKHLGVDRSNIHILHFDWVDDFSKARNFALPYIKTDYWMWADLDDVMRNREAFKSFKREPIGMFDAWYAPYNYALHPDGNPAVSFVRERVFKTSMGFKFRDPIHEAIDVREANSFNNQVTSAWAIDHLRTHAEMLKDKNDGRNIRILEKHRDTLNERLQFYLGKEYYDNERYEDSFKALEKVCKSEKLELGDRIMAMQFVASSLVMMNDYVNAMRYCVLGINLEPLRAEYYCIFADCWIKAGDPDKAIPLLNAAKSCPNSSQKGTRHEFSYSDCYDIFPRGNLAQIYFLKGMFEEAKLELDPIKYKFDEKLKVLYAEIEKAIWSTSINPNAIETDDIVITCPFPTPYTWDEEGYKTKGYGGSETAAIEMAKWLKVKTGRCVKVFQCREETLVSQSGVEYVPVKHLHDYFNKYKPKLHIGWRHCARFTNAPSYVWSHDLFTHNADQGGNYDKILALSEAHKDMLTGMQGIPEDKILITRNGIDPELFKYWEPKLSGKVIWPNSPDRGLEHCIKVMDKVRESIPHAELHCFYGMDNMKKAGGDLAKKALVLEDMIKTRPWIKYHGNVDKKTLIEHFMQSEVWLYTSTFYETYAISALEALASHAWPVLRRFGALKNTMAEAEKLGIGDILDCEMTDPDIIDVFAEKVVSAINEKKWKTIKFDPKSVSWEKLAEEWKTMFKL